MRFRITSANAGGTTRLVTGHAVDALALARDLAKRSGEVWIADDAGQLYSLADFERLVLGWPPG